MEDSFEKTVEFLCHHTAVQRLGLFHTVLVKYNIEAGVLQFEKEKKEC